MAYKIEQGIATWAPAENPKATSDPYKTLFVARVVRIILFFFNTFLEL